MVGPGSGISDSIMARLSNGEHVWTAAEVSAAGGHGAVARMRNRALAGSTEGGNVTVNQTINNPVPERASTSGPKGLRRAANQLGR